jgi:hypothetical protein
MSGPADVLVHYAPGDTVGLVVPITEPAELWLAEHVAADAARVGRALVVEHRYIRALLAGMADAGLTLGAL